MEIKIDDVNDIISRFDDEEKNLFDLKTLELNFIKNLVNERKKKGLSQSELASRVGLTQQAISSLEKYDRKPTLPNLIKYLYGLDININDLFK